MASVSSTTSSLGNTSLRGYGGMASGIDRDAIIEQMTAGTNTKITNQESAITKLEWKQEAYRGISDKLLDLYDNYCSYTSTTSLKDANTFAKSLISVIGKDDVTKFISATGSSDLVDSVAVKAVKQIATSTVRQSAGIKNGRLETTLDDLQDTFMYTSNLAGAQIRFEAQKGEGKDVCVFSMPSTYYEVDEQGKIKEDGNGNKIEKTINYFLQEGEDEDAYGKRLQKELNLALSQSKVVLGKDDKDVKIGNRIAFQYDETSNQMKIIGTGTNPDAKDSNGDPITLSGLGEFKIQSGSTALKGLGYTGTGSESITLDEFNKGVTREFQEAALSETSALEYLAGEKLTFNFDGSKKEIELITKAEAEELKNETDNNKILEKIQANVQNRLNQAFGTNKVKAELIEKEGGKKALAFTTSEKTSTVSISSNDGGVLYNLGISNGASNKVNLNGTLSQNNIGIQLNETRNKQKVDENGDPVFEADGTTPVYEQKLDENGKPVTDKDGNPVYVQESVVKDEYKNGLVINGVTISGIDANTSISSILSKINSNEKVGVKATYVDATGQFMLVSTETGASREINLDSQLAKDLFGQKGTSKDYEEDLGVTTGQDAIVTVSYGNGVDIDIQRASNTFNLEGLTVTVSGVFGGDWSEGRELTEDEVEKYKNGTTKLDDGQRIVEQGEKKLLQDWKTDSSETVSFSAKADVDKVVEKVKKFFEDFNAIATEVNTQVTTRPDSSYGPLTDEQKDEMSETSIENWEKKAKSGLLFNDSTMRDLSMDVQSIYTKLMSQTGLSYEELKELGITYSDNEKDGGILVFDESAFRSAMESNPDKVSSLFTGGNGMGQGLTKIVEDTFTPYATRYASRNGNSYGRLIEEAGSEKIPTSLMKNQIYEEIKSKQDLIESLRAKLQTEQDRYISMFTTMETMINKMNSQASYLSQITG